MKQLKYLLMAGCAFSVVEAQASFNLSGLEYNDSGYWNEDDSVLYPQDKNISGLTIYDDDEHELSFTKSNLEITGNIKGNDDSSLTFGEAGNENHFDFSGANWNNDYSNLKFAGTTYFNIDKNTKGKTLFHTNAGASAVTLADNSSINLIVADGVIADDDTSFTVKATGNEDLINSNVLYNIKKADATTEDWTITTKSADQISAFNNGDNKYYTADEANLLIEMRSGTIAEGISLTTEAQQGKYDTVHEGLYNILYSRELTSLRSKAMGMNGDKATQEDSQAVNDAINRVVASRQSLGIAGGEEMETSINLIPWVQGMFNHTHNTQSAGYSANVKGIAMGIDAQINNAWTVGIGYSNSATRVKSDYDSVRGYADNGFAYAQYKPNNWYVRGMVGYGQIDYKNSNQDKWDVETYVANAYTGYVWGVLDTSIGLRYSYFNNDTYTRDGATVSTKDTDTLTGVVDFKVSQEYAAKDWMITPSAHVGFTYDVISADNASNISLVGTYASFQYDNNGERLHKAGVEAGTGIAFKYGASELHLNYEGAFREDNYTNGGFVKFKYNF